MGLNRRVGWLLCGLALLACDVWLASEVGRAQLDPSHPWAEERTAFWLAGPSSALLEQRAADRVHGAIQRLQDTRLAPEQRLAGYREQLEAAERLLLRSLRAQAARAGALTQLAAVRWELAFPQDDAQRQRNSELIALASTMAPTAATVQLQLGEVMFKMGERVEGADYCRRAVALNPQLSRDAVRVLGENLFSAADIAETLPPAPETVVALEAAYFEESAGEDYLALAEHVLDDTRRPSPALLAAYGHACRQLQEEPRLLERMERLGAQADPAIEAERLRQRSWALMSAGHVELALADARRARELQPDVFYFADHLGNLTLQAGDAEGAIRAYRAALRIVAAGTGSADVRARLYSSIGAAEERRGRSDRAYEAYRHSLRLNPDERRARRRVREMEAAAGFGPGRGESL